MSNGGVTHRKHQDPIGSIYNNKTYAQNYPVTEGLYFAKMFYSLVLVDLGEQKRPNLLLDEQSLRYILDPDLNRNYNRVQGGYLNNATNNPDTRDSTDWWRWRGIAPPGSIWSADSVIRMEDAYDALPATHNLTTQPARIYTRYTCSIAVPRSLPSVILLTILADLVLLHTSYLILKLIADRFVHKDPHAMHCEGCPPPLPDVESAKGSTDESSPVSPPRSWGSVVDLAPPQDLEASDVAREELVPMLPLPPVSDSSGQLTASSHTSGG